MGLSLPNHNGKAIMDRVRLMGWCAASVGAALLPAFAAAEGGLFAEQGLEVEFVPAAPYRDLSLGGLSVRVEALAAGAADFAITSTAYLMSAKTAAGEQLPARFAAMSYQRNPIVAVVRADSDIHGPADLPGAVAARWCYPWVTDDYVGALAHMGLGPANVVEISGGLNEPLRKGEIDVIPTCMDMTLDHLDPGFPVRVIPLDIEVYTVGLLASDRLSSELVTRMRDAFVAGHHFHRAEPEPGIAALRRCYPHVSEDRLRAAWAAFEPYAFDGVPPGSMDQGRWESTIRHTAAAHRLPVLAPESAYRPELLAGRPAPVEA